MTPALLTSPWIVLVTVLTFSAALRTDELSSRSSSINTTSTVGLVFLISSMTGLTLASVRDASMIRLGLAEARIMAVSAPIPFLLVPVMRTAPAVVSRRL